jgi:hypothetical protein
MAQPLVVGTTDGSVPILKKYPTVSGVAAGDFVTITAGAIALADDTNGAASTLGFVVGSDVPAATDIIPKAGLDQNANGISRMGATGTTTADLTVCVLKTTDIVELDIAGSAQYANTVVGSTIGIKGATGSNMGYNATGYTPQAVITDVVTMPGASTAGRVRVRFLDAELVG